VQALLQYCYRYENAVSQNEKYWGNGSAATREIGKSDGNNRQRGGPQPDGPRAGIHPRLIRLGFSHSAVV